MGAEVAAEEPPKSAEGMLTFAFWNLKKKPIEAVLAQMCAENGVDFLLLAECASPGQVLRSLGSLGCHDYRLVETRCTRLVLLSSLGEGSLDEIHHEQYMSLCRVAVGGMDELLVTTVHLPSRWHWSESSLDQFSVPTAARIREAEERAGHRRTLVIGDFNMEPFSVGMVSAPGFHAAMTRNLARRSERTIQGERHRLLYNPMWSHFGDGSEGPPGTYYRHSAQPVCYFWHMFDQVLLGRDLIDRCTHGDIQILDRIGATPLLTTNGIPDRRFSDHLPLLVRLRI